MSEESVEQKKVGLQPAIVLMTSDEMKKRAATMTPFVMFAYALASG